MCGYDEQIVYLALGAKLVRFQNKVRSFAAEFVREFLILLNTFVWKTKMITLTVPDEVNDVVLCP